jgi:predicted Zn finger-like uncharacterized protein
MLTACPRCGVRLAVTAGALRAARGLCRCGACRALFPAWAHLIDPPAAAIAAAGSAAADDTRSVDAPAAIRYGSPQAPAAAQRGSETGVASAPEIDDPGLELPAAEQASPAESLASPTALTAESADALVRLRPGAEEGAETQPDEGETHPSMPLRAVLDEDIATAAALAGEPGAPHPDDEDDRGVPLDTLPSKMPAERLRDPSWLNAPQAARRPGLRLLWRLALVVLGALLMAQLFLMQAGTLAANWPPARPWIARAWKELARPAPWRRDLERLRVLRSDVRDHPHRAGSLMVTVTLQNDALFEQPFPAIELTLGDALGEQVGRRRFEPDVYLGGDWPRPAFMPIGSPVDVLLELAGSHEGATAFTIELQPSE